LLTKYFYVRNTILRNLKLVFVFALMMPWVNSIQANTDYLPDLKQIASDVNDPQGRTILKFQHSSNSNWGYASSQMDVFYVVIPKEAPSAALPMKVIFHSAGHSAKTCLQSVADPHYLQSSTEPGFYGLYLDCKGHSDVDWWWGWYGIKDDPNKEAKYKNNLCPTEKRMTDTIMWAIEKYKIDINRIYLCGVSMGGSGSLGFGLRRGDLFAAISVAVPAGADHAMWRNNNFINEPKFDPPYLINFSSPVDAWCKGQEVFIPAMLNAKFPLVLAFGPFGHTDNVTSANPAVVEFPWLSIRKDQSYPVFTNATTDQTFPGYDVNNTTSGQINAYFRWENIADDSNDYRIKLRLVASSELSKPVAIPTSSTVDVTPRRLQKFHIRPNTEYKYILTQGGNTIQSGAVFSDGGGLLTIRNVTITTIPLMLEIKK
jgi:predicted esterase